MGREYAAASGRRILAASKGVVVIFNTAKPQAVSCWTASRWPSGEDLESGPEPGWRYDEGTRGCLSIRIVQDGPSTVRVDGAKFRQVTRLARLAERIAFEFTDSLEGWIAMHQVADLAVRDGMLAGKITGPDPYLGRQHAPRAGGRLPGDRPADAGHRRAAAGSVSG